VGRIHPRKGQDKLIKAVNQLPEHLRKKIELCFVGPVVDQSFRRNIEQDANRTSCEIHFLGELSDKELREQYKRADLFSLTSMPRKNSIEGFGFVYLEASSHGLPILAHRVGGVEDAVGHEETGLLVDPLSETDLCHSLERLVSDNHLRSKLGEQGRRWANRHSWKRVAEKLYGES
jgi:glycosyltransferase involved in cell wall biosynthesis